MKPITLRFIIFCVIPVIVSSGVLQGQTIFRLAIPGVNEVHNDKNQKETGIFPYTGQFVQTVTHDGVLNYIDDGDYIINFDYDPDNEIIPITGMPGSLNEANWVVYAKRKGCKIWWVRPWWLKKGEGFRLYGDKTFEDIINDIYDLPNIDKEVVLTFCMDYFANKPTQIGDYEEWAPRVGYNPTLNEIANHLKKLVDLMRRKGIKVKLVHLAESPEYSYPEYKDTVMSQIIERMTSKEAERADYSRKAGIVSGVFNRVKLLFRSN
jgi:hypothetical protein